ncbi:MAG: glycerophosphodiester phosphodiesterase, partial [Propionibacteriales bacterium]|nr:glycerophosphodiester phosphodiesterase [Propionibacteriales bacterium]
MIRQLATTAVVALLTLGLPAVALAAPTNAPTPNEGLTRPSRGFDLQAHRGGLGLTTESTLAGFAKALDLGVSTLELDTQLTKETRVEVTHPRKVSA